MSQIFIQGQFISLEILVISSQKIPRIVICMYSGEQKCQNDLKN